MSPNMTTGNADRELISENQSIAPTLASGFRPLPRRTPAHQAFVASLQFIVGGYICREWCCRGLVDRLDTKQAYMRARLRPKSS